MSEFEGTNFLDFKRELLKDDRERQEYEQLKSKYNMIQKIIEYRKFFLNNIAKKRCCLKLFNID